jgi:hypothetical protein
MERGTGTVIRTDFTSDAIQNAFRAIAQDPRVSGELPITQAILDLWINTETKEGQAGQLRFLAEILESAADALAPKPKSKLWDAIEASEDQNVTLYTHAGNMFMGTLVRVGTVLELNHKTGTTRLLADDISAIISDD